MTLTNVQRQLAEKMGFSYSEAAKLRIADIFEISGLAKEQENHFRYVGPGPGRAEKSLREYLEWRIQREGSIPQPDDSFFLKVPRTRLEDNYLTRCEMLKLLRAIKSQKDSGQAARDLAMIELLYRTGLRVAEASQLNVGDITDGNGKLVKLLEVLGKGNKKRKIPVVKTTMAGLRKWLTWKKRLGEDISPQEPLFLSRNNKRLSVRQIQRIVKKWVEIAGVNRITTHGLRHTFATHIVNGSPQGLKAAQQALGHSSIATTEIYTHLSADEYGQAMEVLL